MNGHKLRGRHYQTGESVEIDVADNRIRSVIPVAHDPEYPWLAPALVDLQVNGYAGVDFQRDIVTADDLHHAAAALARDGCGAWLLTLITDEWQSLLRRLARLKALRDQSPHLRETILGWHIEGPYLSTEPGYRGAHNEAMMSNPGTAAIEELYQITTGDPVLLTLAPEREGSPQAVARAASLGMRVSAGHTNATAEQLQRAVEAGLTAFTHLGNGMPQVIDRHDNIVCRALDTDGLTYGLIPDGIHVSPQLFRLFHRVLPADRIYYTTDAMAAAGAPPGRYTIGRVELEVGEDEVVRMPGATNFAGSALRPIDGVRRAARMLGLDWRKVWDTASVNPARLMGWNHGLKAGCPAKVLTLTGDAVIQRA